MERNQPAHQDILHVQEQFWAAARTRDAAMLTALLAPTFVGRSPGEADQTREAFVATLLAFPASISATRNVKPPGLSCGDETPPTGASSNLQPEKVDVI
jgi:hypothetical protein